MDQPNIARGFHFSVRELDNPDVIVGHDKYNYYNNKDRELLWLRFEKSWTQAREEDITLAGLPHCVFHALDWLPLDELTWARCPSSKVHPKSMEGLSKEFLAKLGIYDEKYINGEVGLILEFMITY
jgi:hypothetical protein